MSAAITTGTRDASPAPAVTTNWPADDLNPSEHISLRLREFWQAGYDEAERTYHVQGWRKGFVDGVVSGVLVGVLGMWVALQFGRWLVAP